jgi:hypothetical protein
MKQINAPVLFMVFNRPEKTKQVWEQIKIAKPKKLYVSSDAARQTHPDDFHKVERVRKIVSDVDWECDVKYLLHEKNLGCSLAGKTAFDWVFSKEIEMIELEDDVVPSQSFFWFMQEMLEKYKDDKRICYVCAENYGIKSGKATYFFSQYGGSWGWATWKRVYDMWEYILDSLELVVNSSEFKNTFPSKFQYQYWKRNFEYWKYFGGNTYDLQTVYLIHKHNMINIFPNINLVSNIGWDLEASNTKVDNSENKLAKKFGNKPRFEIEEIIHPTVIESNSKIDTALFKFHFQNGWQMKNRFRWFVSPYYQKLLLLLGKGKNK